MITREGGYDRRFVCGCFLCSLQNTYCNESQDAGRRLITLSSLQLQDSHVSLVLGVFVAVW